MTSKCCFRSLLNIHTHSSNINSISETTVALLQIFNPFFSRLVNDFFSSKNRSAVVIYILNYLHKTTQNVCEECTLNCKIVSLTSNTPDEKCNVTCISIGHCLQIL